MTIETLTRKLHHELSALLPDFEITEKSAAETPKGKACLCIGRAELPAAMMIYPSDYAGASDADIRRIAASVAEQSGSVYEMSELVAGSALSDSEKLDAFPAWKGMDLTGIPHYTVPGTDISLIARVVLGKSGTAEMSCLVTDAQMEMFHDTGEEVLRKAMENTFARAGFTITPLSEKFMELCAEEDLAEMIRDAESQQTLWLITNRRSFNGASAIAFPEILKEAYRKIGESYYILPSSRHELLAAGISCITDSMSEKDLTDLVRHVNITQVEERDRLSDSVFCFDGEKLCMVTP